MEREYKDPASSDGFACSNRSLSLFVQVSQEKGERRAVQGLGHKALVVLQGPQVKDC